MHLYYLFHHSYFPQCTELSNVFCMLGNKALESSKENKTNYILQYKCSSFEELQKAWVDEYMCRHFLFQMLVICMSGFFQGHIVRRARSSWFIILHKNPADDSIMSELGLEAPVIGFEEYISKEELSLTPVTVKK